MRKLNIQDITVSSSMDAATMTEIRGGLTANVNNSQQANQAVAGSYGPVFAVNSPISAPSTVLTESNPVTTVDLTSINMMNAFQNTFQRGIFAV